MFIPSSETGKRIGISIQTIVGKGTEVWNNGMSDCYAKIVPLNTARRIGNIPVTCLFLASPIEESGLASSASYRIAPENAWLIPRHIEVTSDGALGSFRDPTITPSFPEELIEDLGNLGFVGQQYALELDAAN